MAGALVQGVLQSGAFSKESLIVADRHSETANKLAAQTGARLANDNHELAAQSDVLLICVKPTDAHSALAEIRDGAEGKLIISIMAGLTIAALHKAVPGSRIARVMPNTPALIHQGAAAYALGAGATDADSVLVEKIFAAVGAIFRVEEKLIDAVTGLSGSGPAYVYLMIEALADGGVLMGLPRDLALRLAAQTVAGAAGMVLQTGQHPAALKDQVASPGGTTIAGIEALEAGGMRSAFLAAVRAATERSRELGAKS
jgi:pyrroline-5-carboxylate reductase